MDHHSMVYLRKDRVNFELADMRVSSIQVCIEYCDLQME